MKVKYNGYWYYSPTIKREGYSIVDDRIYIPCAGTRIPKKRIRDIIKALNITISCEDFAPDIQGRHCVVYEYACPYALGVEPDSCIHKERV